MITILIISAILIILSTLLAVVGFLAHIAALGIFALALFVLAIGLAAGSAIIYFTTKDDYKKAVIFEDDGGRNGHIRKRSGSFYKQENFAIQYMYGKGNILTVPDDYGFKYFAHKRKIDIDASGSLIFPAGKAIRQSIYNEMIKELTLGHIGRDAILAVSSNKFSMNWIIIAVIALIIGAVGMSVFNQFQNRQAVPVQPPAQSQPVQPQYTPIIIEGGPNP